MADITEAQKAHYKKVFDKVDSDSNGSIDRHELAKVFKKLDQKVGKKELARMFDKADLDGNGQIDFDEFLAVVGDSHLHADDDLKETFKLFDKNEDGTIDAKELQNAMQEYYGANLTDAEVAAMIDEADKDGDRKLSFPEFKAIMTAKPADK